MATEVLLRAPLYGMATPEDAALGSATMRRVSLRLLPFIFVLYVFNFLDRTNVALAALQMNRDLQFSSSAFGLGAGIFFLGYALCEVPSNLLMARVGARRWIARIMISWGLIACAMMFVRTPMQFYAARFALGVAEAGFFPGIVFYLSQWFPTSQRARASARFMIGIPLAGVLGGLVGGQLLGLDGRLGLAGWQWLFLVEGIPSVLLGAVVLGWLTDRPEQAHWLTDAQRSWLTTRLLREENASQTQHGLPPLAALVHPLLWLAALPYLLSNTAAYGYLFWAPTLIKASLHTSNANTGVILAVIAFLGAVGMIAIGESSDRNGERCLHAGGAVALSALGYLGAALLPTPVLRICSLALVQMGGVAFIVPYFCLPALLFRGAALAVAIALVNSIGNLGGFLGPNVIGVLTTLTGGTTGAFLALSALSAIAAAMCVGMRRLPAFRQLTPPSRDCAM